MAFLESFESHCSNCDFFRCKKNLDGQIYYAFCWHPKNVEDKQGNNSFVKCPLNVIELESLLSIKV